MTTHRQKFRAMLNSNQMILAPGVYDGFTATLVANAGFDALYMTGAGTSMSKGYPDYGLMTMTEMVANASTIVDASDLPLIADADTGYGNELNVTRTVRDYERAGVTAIHIEDQGFPKKCGHLDDKEIVPLDDYIAKIRAASDARTDPDFLIIARTDSRAVIGFDEAVCRANAALAAGADIAFVEAPQTMDELRAVPKEVNGPCLFNYVEGGKTPGVDMATAQEMGFKLTILPSMLMREVVMSCERVLGDLKEYGRLPNPDEGIKVHELFDRFGAARWDALRNQFADAAE